MATSSKILNAIKLLLSIDDKDVEIVEEVTKAVITKEVEEIQKGSEDVGEVTLIKAFQEDEQISVEIIAEPLTPDAHGHWYSKDTVKGGHDSFDELWKAGALPMNMFHMKDDDGTNIELVKHYVMPCEVTIGETLVKEGTWIGEIKWHNDELWKARTVPREDGTLEIAGVSIKGWGHVQDAVNSDTGSATE